MGHTLDLDLIGNPLGKRIGGGYTTCRVGDGARVHIEGRNGGPICMQHVVHLTNLRASNARVVDCYRCIKQISFQSNAPMLDRSLTPGRGGAARAHKMVPGGRQGPLVGARVPRKHAEPPWVSSMKGVEPFPRGSERHPTQTRLRGQVGAAGRASTREFRKSSAGQALPPGYFPPITREEEVAMLAMRGPILPAEVYTGKGKVRGRKPSQKEVAAAIAAAGGMRANPKYPTLAQETAARRKYPDDTEFWPSRKLAKQLVRDGVASDKRTAISMAEATIQFGTQNRANPRGRVETARNGRHFIRLANGQVRFVA